jgi:pimeloyl-ACP methyl ester carboxylesterase
MIRTREAAMTTFVLVHGGFGSPAELASVIPELEALGHDAIAVDLPCTDPEATLEDYGRTVVDAMDGLHPPIVVVGHSAGGATISLVPDLTRVERLVYVTAFVPEPGRSIVDIAGADVRDMILSISHDDGNGCRSFDLELLASIVPPEERAPYLAFLRATQRPQGWAAMEQPWPGRSLPAVPCTYVICTEDNVLPPATQRQMAARLGVEPIEIASDHAVFALRPHELASLLVGSADWRS